MNLSLAVGFARKKISTILADVRRAISEEFYSLFPALQEALEKGNWNLLRTRGSDGFVGYIGSTANPIPRDIIEDVLKELDIELSDPEENEYQIEKLFNEKAPMDPDYQDYLADCFDLLFIIALAGNKSCLIGNMDALNMLFSILTNSTNIDVRIRAVSCIQDLLSINTANVVHIFKTNGIERLLDVFSNWNKKDPIVSFSEEKELEFFKVMVNVLKKISFYFYNYDPDVLSRFLNLITVFYSKSSFEEILIEADDQLFNEFLIQEIEISGAVTQLYAILSALLEELANVNVEETCVFAVVNKRGQELVETLLDVMKLTLKIENALPTIVKQRVEEIGGHELGIQICFLVLASNRSNQRVADSFSNALYDIIKGRELRKIYIQRVFSYNELFSLCLDACVDVLTMFYLIVELSLISDTPVDTKNLNLLDLECLPNFELSKGEELRKLVLYMLSNCSAETVNKIISSLVIICESNPRNKKIFGGLDFTGFLIEIALHSEASRMTVSKLLVSLLSYRIKMEELDVLLKLLMYPVPLKRLLETKNVYCEDENTSESEDGDSNPEISKKGMMKRQESGSSFSSKKSSRTGSSSSLVSTPEVKHKYQSDEFQMQLFYVLGRVCETNDPPVYFYLNGISGVLTLPTFEKFPAAKTGYTFACRIKPTKFHSSEIVLFALHDSAGNPAVRLFLKRFQPFVTNEQDSYSTTSSFVAGANSGFDHCLCVKIRNSLTSHDEDFVIDAVTFQVTSAKWYHIVFTHKRKVMKVYIDGELCHLSSTSLFPEKRFKCYIGGEPVASEVADDTLVDDKVVAPIRMVRTTTKQRVRRDTEGRFITTTTTTTTTTMTQQLGSTESDGADQGRDNVVGVATIYRGFFAGCMTDVTLCEGCWDDDNVQQHYSCSQQNMSYLLHVWPSDNLPRIPGGKVQKHGPPNVLLSENPSSVAWFYEDWASSLKKSLLFLSSSGDSGSRNELLRSILSDGVLIHETRSLKGAIQEMENGMELCFTFLDGIGQDLLLGGLQLLYGIIHKNERGYDRFLNLNGYSIIYHLLLKHPSEISMNVFDILCDILSDGEVDHEIDRPIFKRVECLVMIVDILMGLSGGSSLKRKMFKYFANSVESGRNNVEIWMKGPRLISLLYLLVQTKQKEARYSVIRLLSKMDDNLNEKDLVTLFDFAVVHKDDNSDSVNEVLDHFLQRLKMSSMHVDILKKNPVYMRYVLALCYSKYEPIRVQALKLLSVLFMSSKQRQLFFKSFGFEFLSKVLKDHLPFSIKSFVALLGLAFTHNKEPKYKSVDHSSIEPPSPELHGIPASNNPSMGDFNEGVVTQSLKVIIELLTGYARENIGLQLQVLKDLEALLQEDHNLEMMWETDWFVTHIWQYYTNRVMDNPVRKIVGTILERFIWYALRYKTTYIKEIREIHEREQLQLDFTLLVVGMLGRSEICVLKDHEAHDVFKGLVFLFRNIEQLDGFTVEHSLQIINSVNGIAVQNSATVRNALKRSGLLDIRDNLILYWLTHTKPEERIHDEEADMPKLTESSTESESGEEDDELEKQKGKSHSRSASCSIDDVISPSFIEKAIVHSRGQEEVKESDLVEERFLEWFYGEEMKEKRHLVEAKIDKIVSPFDQSYKKYQEKLAARKAKRLKSRMEKLTRALSAQQKGVDELEEKIEVLVQKSVKRLEFEKREFDKHREGRAKNGKESWEGIVQQLRTFFIENEVIQSALESENYREELLKNFGNVAESQS